MSQTVALSWNQRSVCGITVTQCMQTVVRRCATQTQTMECHGLALQGCHSSPPWASFHSGHGNNNKTTVATLISPMLTNQENSESSFGKCVFLAETKDHETEIVANHQICWIVPEFNSGNVRQKCHSSKRTSHEKPSLTLQLPPFKHHVTSGLIHSKEIAFAGLQVQKECNCSGALTN